LPKRLHITPDVLQPNGHGIIPKGFSSFTPVPSQVCRATP
jgi:hypothetical protein